MAEGDEGIALTLTLAARAGEGLRRGGWWAAGAGVGALLAQATADVAFTLTLGMWSQPSREGYVLALVSAGATGLAIGSPPLADPREEPPNALVAVALVTPWLVVILQTVVAAALTGDTTLHGLEAAIAELRDPDGRLVNRFLGVVGHALSLGAARYVLAGGAAGGQLFFRPLVLRPDSIRAAVIAGALVPCFVAAIVELGGLIDGTAMLPVVAYLAVGGVTVPGGALLAERRLRPWLRAWLVGHDADPGGEPPPPVSSRR